MLWKLLCLAALCSAAPIEPGASGMLTQISPVSDIIRLLSSRWPCNPYTAPGGSGSAGGDRGGRPRLPLLLPRVLPGKDSIGPRVEDLRYQRANPKIGEVSKVGMVSVLSNAY